MSVAQFLDRTVTIERFALSQGATGASTRAATPTALATGLAAAIAPAKGQVVYDFSRRSIVVDHTVFFAVDLDAVITGGPRASDRVNDNGALYIVKGLSRWVNPKVTNQIVYELHCERRIA